MDHSFITSAYGLLGGWVQKIAIFADLQYFIYADVVGGLKLVSKELNHLAAILHVYAGSLIFMK